MAYRGLSSILKPAYLEDYLDAVSGLPAEVRDKYRQVGELDGEATRLQREAEALIVECTRKPRTGGSSGGGVQKPSRQQARAASFSGPASAASASSAAPASRTALTPKQSEALRKKWARVEQMQRQCARLGDEKLKLAEEVYAAVDAHVRDLDAKLREYEAYLRREGQWPAGAVGVLPTAPGAAGAASAGANGQLRSVQTGGRAPNGHSAAAAAGAVAGSGGGGGGVSGQHQPAPGQQRVQQQGRGVSEPARQAPLPPPQQEQGQAQAWQRQEGHQQPGGRRRRRRQQEQEQASQLDPAAEAAAAGELQPNGQQADAQLMPIVDDMPVDPNEPRYCYCQQVSYGEMVECENPNCPFEWFHFQCVGLTEAPSGNWICPDCRAKA